MVRVALLLALFATGGFQFPVYRYPRQPYPHEAARNPAVRPVLRKSVPPQYTPEARKARVQGVVILEVVVERDGRISGGKVLKPLPFGLTQKAIDSLKEYRYTPAKNARGETVRCLMNVLVQFKL